MKTRLLIAKATLLCAIASIQAQTVEIRYSGDIQIRDVESGKAYLTNRKYQLARIPKEIEGLKFTALPGGANKDIQAKIPKGTTVYLALDSEKKTALDDIIRKYSAELEKAGWKYLGKIEVTDKRMENMRVLVKTFNEESTVEYKGVGFVGTIVIAKDLDLKGR